MSTFMLATGSLRDQQLHLKYYKCCCRKFKVTAMAKPAALISALIYIFYILIFTVFYRWFITFPILIGVFMYWTLYVGIFHRRSLMLLPYLIFEAVSMIVYFVSLVWLCLFMMNIIQLENTSLDDYSHEHLSHTTITADLSTYLGYTIFLIWATVFSIAIKTWIFSVILSLHRYLRFEEEYGELVYAQYVNGGVRIDTNSGVFSYPAPAPPFSADASGAPPQYFTNTFDGNNYPVLPSYESAMSTTKNQQLRS